MPNTEEKQYDEINAMPRKALFIDILTRDVSVRDCILDLVDNSVDSYIRNNLQDQRCIRINLTETGFDIVDDCGGIEYGFLKNEVFRFGANIKRNKPTLGIYGIGMKRAMLKIGGNIILETDDGIKYCKVNFNVDEWITHENWKIPFRTVAGSKLSKTEKGYTRIRIQNLHPQIQKKFALVSFLNSLRETLHITYSYFLNRKISIFVNTQKVEPYKIEVRYDDDYKPVKIKKELDGVLVEVICFVDPRKGRAKKELGKRGWNIFCNKRLILKEEQSETTGWSGEKGQLPKYHSIYHEFRGIVFIDSDDPSRLPLNTSKSGLDKETPIYYQILKLMVKTARPLVDYLSRKYDKAKESIDEIEESMEEGEISLEKNGEEKPKYISIEDLRIRRVSLPRRKKGKEITTITYTREKKIVEKVKQYLKATSNRTVGEETFNYFLEMEGIEDD